MATGCEGCDGYKKYLMTIGTGLMLINLRVHYSSNDRLLSIVVAFIEYLGLTCVWFALRFRFRGPPGIR